MGVIDNKGLFRDYVFGIVLIFNDFPRPVTPKVAGSSPVILAILLN